MDSIDKVFLYLVCLTVGYGVYKSLPCSYDPERTRKRIERAIGKSQELAQLSQTIQAKALSYDLKRYSAQEYLMVIAQIIDMQNTLIQEDLRIAIAELAEDKAQGSIINLLTK